MTEPTIQSRTYRMLDVVTKLGGLGLLVAALELGVTSIAGGTLALGGVLLGVTTVFVTKGA